MSDKASTIAKHLLDIEAVRISMDPPFTWTSGIKSPIYCDNRMMISFPEKRNDIVKGFVELIKERGHEPDVVAGTATAGIPWAAFVAHEMNIPMAYIRPEPKGHGAGKQIEGVIKPGQKVVIIEDLISTGGSSVKSANAVKNEGQAEVLDVLAIVTYGMEKAKKNFEEAGFNHSTLTDFAHLIEQASSMGAITEEQKSMVLEFAADPATWGEKMGLV